MEKTCKLPVITISRQYGAGGRSLAKELSKRLDIPWFDNDFVKKTALESGYSEEDVRIEGEEISGVQIKLDAVLNSANSYTSSHDAIFSAEKKALISLAKSPCIIVGRCANVVLGNEDISTFDIFLYADKELRIQRMMDKENISESVSAKEQKKHDTYRKNFYEKYTGHDMENPNDYDICINTGIIEYDDAADLIIDCFRKKGWV